MIKTPDYIPIMIIRKRLIIFPLQLLRGPVSH
jgi:hypothetical protein